MTVQGIADVEIVSDPAEIANAKSPKGKPFLRIKFEGGVSVDITTNLAEMIGGAGAGTRLRYEGERNAAN
jgi:hypothetical protein